MENLNQVLADQTNTNAIQHYEIIKRDKVEGTPFDIVSTDEGSFGAFGQYRLTDFMNYDQVHDRILSKDWEILFSVMIALINHDKSQSK